MNTSLKKFGGFFILLGMMLLWLISPIPWYVILVLTTVSLYGFQAFIPESLNVPQTLMDAIWVVFLYTYLYGFYPTQMLALKAAFSENSSDKHEFYKNSHCYANGKWSNFVQKMTVYAYLCDYSPVFDSDKLTILSKSVDVESQPPKALPQTPAPIKVISIDDMNSIITTLENALKTEKQPSINVMHVHELKGVIEETVAALISNQKTEKQPTSDDNIKHIVEMTIAALNNVQQVPEKLPVQETPQAQTDWEYDDYVDYDDSSSARLFLNSAVNNNRFSNQKTAPRYQKNNHRIQSSQYQSQNQHSSQVSNSRVNSQTSTQPSQNQMVKKTSTYDNIKF